MIDLQEIQHSVNRSTKIYDEYLNTNDFRHVAIVEGLAFLGLFIMFTGYKYIRFAMFAAGFWLAFCLFYVFSPIILRKQYCCDKERYREVHIGSSVAVGLVIGVLTTSLYRFGVFLIGKCLGILVALFILHSAVDVHTTSKLLISGIVTVMAFIFGSLTWRCERPLLILSTSLLGSFFVLCGKLCGKIIHFFVKTS